KTTARPLFSVADIHGWSNLMGAAPLSIICLTVALLKEALKVIALRHWCFLLSQSWTNIRRAAMPAANHDLLLVTWLSFVFSRGYVFPTMDQEIDQC
ncbi:MAG: hypothetical protein ACKPKO_57750, partial [Candidatus Fonsibacter sp.]